LKCASTIERLDQTIQIARQSERRDIDNRTADDLVRSNTDRQPGMEEGNQHSSHDGRDHPRNQGRRCPKERAPFAGKGLVNEERSHKSDVRGEEHHPFDTNIHNTTAFVQDTA
jgi:hypothetical protein